MTNNCCENCWVDYLPLTEPYCQNASCKCHDQTELEKLVELHEKELLNLLEMFNLQSASYTNRPVVAFDRRPYHEFRKVAQFITKAYSLGSSSQLQKLKRVVEGYRPKQSMWAQYIEAREFNRILDDFLRELNKEIYENRNL